MPLYSPDELRKSVQIKKRKYIIIVLIRALIILVLVCSAIYAKRYIDENCASIISKGFIVEESFNIE